MFPPCALRLATPADTETIAELMLAAGGGLFEQILEGAVPELSVAALLALGINDETSPWHFNNALLAQAGSTICGLALAYPAEEYGLSALARELVAPDRLAPLEPLLASVPPPSVYVNSLAVQADHARRGIATQLLRAVAALAEAEGRDRLTLHVWRDNLPAMRLYACLGFTPLETVEMPGTAYFQFAGPVVLAAARTKDVLAHG